MNNDEIAKHTGVPIGRVNQIEAEEFDRISKAITPRPVYVETADDERLKQERDDLAASAKEENARLARILKYQYWATQQITNILNGLVSLDRERFSKAGRKFNSSADVIIEFSRSLLLQLQQEKERAAACNRPNTAYSENLSAVQAALDFLDEGSGANTTVALGLKAAEEINSLRAELLQCQAACAKKDEALNRALAAGDPEEDWDDIAKAIQDALAISTAPATAMAEAERGMA